ncbi:MAG: VPS10 domain-containing protein, partial [Longimicrobiales bacterium]
MSIHDGISTYGNLTVVGESHFTADVIYVGSDDGNVQVTMDGGDSWTDVTGNIPGLPARTYVSRLAPSAHEPGRVYASFDGHRNGDYEAYVYVSENYGEDWERIDDGLPSGWSVNVVVEHHRAPNLLFAGNEIGIYVSIDRGQNWTRLKSNFPTVPVDDLVIHPRENDLIVGTHGRSAWILEDIGPLEHLSQAVMASVAHIFPIRNTIMWAQKGDWPFYGATYSAPNPPRATRLRYYVRDELSDDVDFSVVITDAAGEHVRTFDGPHEPGINEILWDWRYDRPYDPPQGGGGGPGGFGGGAPEGPIVMPGMYTVTVQLDGTTSSETAQIEADPRRSMTMADRRARQDALMSLHRLAGPLNDATQAGRTLDGQLDEASDLLADFEGETEMLHEELEAIQAELEEIADGLGEARRWTGVAGAIQGSSTLPTEDQLWQIDSAWEAVPPLVERLNALITERVPSFNSSLDAMGVRPSPGERLTVPRRGG